MPMNKQRILDIIVRIEAKVRRSGLVRILPPRGRAARARLWRHFVTGNRLLRDIPFGFDAQVSGTRFHLHGPFGCAGGLYYVTYLTEGAYEAPVTAHITQVVRQCSAPRVLDVGAHYGWYTIYLSKVIADRGVVFAFEPSEAIFSLLRRNVELNALHNVRLFKLPLSDKRETIRMVPSKSVPWESRRMHSVAEREAMDNSTGTLEAIPFDELNEMEAIHPNIVKIDVHGVWRKVVDGMRESLHREVEHLYLEVDTPWGDLSSEYRDIQHVILTLRDAGMDVYEVQDLMKRDGGKMIKADENRIAERGGMFAMLYAVKRR
jgi:FkbM family methyltransferase